MRTLPRPSNGSKPSLLATLLSAAFLVGCGRASSGIHHAPPSLDPASPMVVPLAIAIRCRWLIRLGLIGYAATAIVAWYLTGPRYDVAYVAKAVEVALIALLAIEVRAYDGNPLRRLRQVLRPSGPAARA